MTVRIPDALPDIRYWLRTHPDLQPFHNGRVFFRIPAEPGGWPLIRLYRTGGGMIAKGGDMNLSDVVTGIDVWGNQLSGYQQVRQLAVATQSALWQLTPGLLNPSGQTVALAADPTGIVDHPDPESGWPRIAITASWTIQGL